MLKASWVARFSEGKGDVRMIPVSREKIYILGTGRGEKFHFVSEGGEETPSFSLLLIKQKSCDAGKGRRKRP